MKYTASKRQGPAHTLHHYPRATVQPHVEREDTDPAGHAPAAGKPVGGWDGRGGRNRQI